jgi:hypothetical protein
VSEPERRGQDPAKHELPELLQELRVAQAGVQFLAGFLLSISFTDRFAHSSTLLRGVHLVSMFCATGSAALLIAPVSWHRLLAGYGRNAKVVHMSSRFAVTGLVLLGLAMGGSVFLVTDVAMGGWYAVLTTALTFLLFALLWWILPLRARPRARDHGPGSRARR